MRGVSRPGSGVLQQCLQPVWGVIWQHVVETGKEVWSHLPGMCTQTYPGSFIDRSERWKVWRVQNHAPVKGQEMFWACVLVHFSLNTNRPDGRVGPVAEEHPSVTQRICTLICGDEKWWCGRLNRVVQKPELRHDNGDRVKVRNRGSLPESSQLRHKEMQMALRQVVDGWRGHSQNKT